MVCISGCGLSLSGWGKGGGGPGRNTGINCGGTSNLFCNSLNLTCNNNRTKHHVNMYTCTCTCAFHPSLPLKLSTCLLLSCSLYSVLSDPLSVAECPTCNRIFLHRAS